MFKVILKIANMNSYRPKYNKNCPYPFNATILHLRKKSKPLLKHPFHNRLESTENAFNRKQSKNNAEETETHMFFSMCIFSHTTVILQCPLLGLVR